MSQSRFSIVLVGVSALLRRPLVSRLRPAAFTARCSGGFCRSALPSVSEIAAGRVGLRAHGFRFSARTASGLPSASWFFCLPLRGCPWRVGSSAFRFGVAARRVGLLAHRFRFSARTASELPSAGWFFCLPFRRLPLGELAFGLTASAFRHAPLRGCPRRVGASAFRFGDCCSAGWPSGSPLSLFGTHRSASPHRRSEGRRSTPTRHLFHFKTLIPTC